jgi:hypothetical protein
LWLKLIFKFLILRKKHVPYFLFLIYQTASIVYSAINSIPSGMRRIYDYSILKILVRLLYDLIGLRFYKRISLKSLYNSENRPKLRVNILHGKKQDLAGILFKFKGSTKNILNSQDKNSARCCFFHAKY